MALVAISASVACGARDSGLAASQGTTPLVTECEAKIEPIDDRLSVASAVYESDQYFSVHVTGCRYPGEALPIVYVLHGAGTDDTQWSDVDVYDASDRAVAAGLAAPMILVAPDAAPAYSCSDCADDLTHHLLDEIEPIVSSLQSVDPHKRAIAGISRGGGLALRIAAQNPDRFIAVAAHSSVPVSDEVLVSLAEHRTEVSLDVGQDDPLIVATQDMAQRLADLGATVSVRINDGAHDRTYWRGQSDFYVATYAAWFESSR